MHGWNIIWPLITPTLLKGTIKLWLLAGKTKFKFFFSPIFPSFLPFSWQSNEALVLLISVDEDFLWEVSIQMVPIFPGASRLIMQDITADPLQSLIIYQYIFLKPTTSRTKWEKTKRSCTLHIKIWLLMLVITCGFHALQSKGHIP